LTGVLGLVEEGLEGEGEEDEIDRVEPEEEEEDAGARVLGVGWREKRSEKWAESG